MSKDQRLSAVCPSPVKGWVTCAKEFEFVNGQGGLVVAWPFGIEGGTQGEGLSDAIEMAADYLRLWVVDELRAGREPLGGPMGNEPSRGGRVIAVGVSIRVA